MIKQISIITAMGAKMDAELFKPLRVAAKAYYDRQNP